MGSRRPPDKNGIEQVENEYGSYGDDHAYLRWVRDALVERGVSELLYTADGPAELIQDGGSLPGVTAPHPLSFEDLAQPSGLVLYRAHPLLPRGTHELTVHGLHDRAQVFLDGSSDAFLAFPGFGKGFAWVNGTLLGRYREIGPQVTRYVPAPLLTPGDNTITVLELEHFGERIELREGPGLGPAEEYVETFS